MSQGDLEGDSIDFPNNSMEKSIEKEPGQTQRDIIFISSIIE